MVEMTDERAAEVLAAHNEWRRYDGFPGEPGAPTMGDPAELGRAIDHVVSRLRSQPPAEAQAQGGGELPRLAMPVHIGLYQGPDDCPHLQLNGISVAVFPAGSWSEVCDALDSITGGTAPPSAPVDLVSALQSMRDRMMAALTPKFGDAFDGDFDTMLEAINTMKRFSRRPSPSSPQPWRAQR